jgi:hypothetical protein
LIWNIDGIIRRCPACVPMLPWRRALTYPLEEAPTIVIFAHQQQHLNRPMLDLDGGGQKVPPADFATSRQIRDGPHIPAPRETREVVAPYLDRA